MDWKEILRRRIATPNTGPNSEFGRGRPQREPGSKLREVVGRMDGEEQHLGAVPFASVKPLLTKEADWDVV